MYIPLTVVTLALFIAAIVVLRLRWTRLSRKLKRWMILAAIVPVVLLLLAFAARLSTTNDRLNTAVYWGFVLGYIFFVVIFTLLRPVWLTSLVAIILLLPLLSASAIFPLAAIFSHQPHQTRILGNDLVSDLVGVDAITPGASGADLTIYRRLSWAPFLRRKVEGARYFNTQCDASAAYVTLLPDNHHLRYICPATPGAPPETKIDLIRVYSH